MNARAVALTALLASCGACKHDHSAATDAASAPSSIVASATTAAPTTAPTRTAADLPPPGDAGPNGCATLEGPTKLARPGPYTVVLRSGFADFYAEDTGKPVLAGSVKVDNAGLPSSAAPAVASASGHVGKPPCAAAGTFVFCMNSSGEIRRFRPGSSEDAVVAHARPGTRIAASLVGSHPVVAYLRDHMTTEGQVSEAYVQADDGAEQRLSEDGAGATTVALAPRGGGAVATYVDARRAMSPVHARTLAFGPRLLLGKDAVLFIAGSAEPGTRVALGVAGAKAFVLLPVAHDLAFGLATVAFDGEPPTDAAVVWNDYPNGLDPAPVAATQNGSTVFVARVRPSAPKFGSPHVLEIGTLEPAGTFDSLGAVPTSGAPIDVAVASDGASGFVLAYTDASGGYAERLACKKP